jgi:hypothetical protein
MVQRRTLLSRTSVSVSAGVFFRFTDAIHRSYQFSPPCGRAGALRASRPSETSPTQRRQIVVAGQRVRVDHGGGRPALLRHFPAVAARVNGNPALLYYVSPTQINALTPLDNTTGPVTVIVTNNLSSASYTANLQTVTPTFLLFDVNKHYHRHPRRRQPPGTNLSRTILHPRGARRNHRHLRGRIRLAIAGSIANAANLPGLRHPRDRRLCGNKRLPWPVSAQPRHSHQRSQR